MRACLSDQTSSRGTGQLNRRISTAENRGNWNLITPPPPWRGILHTIISPAMQTPSRNSCLLIGWTHTESNC